MDRYRYEGLSSEPSPQERLAIWLRYIDAIPWRPGELDCQEFCAFSKAAFYGIDQETAFAHVIERMRRCGARDLRLSKIQRSLRQAYANGGDSSDSSTPPPLKLPPIESYSEERLREEVGPLVEEVDESFFIERTPFSTWNRSPAGVLHKLTLPGESVWVTADDCSSAGCLWRNDGLEGCSARWVSPAGNDESPDPFTGNFDCLSYFERGRRNVWFLNNPISGKPHSDDRFTHGQSWRCIEAVISWRYLVLETDIAPVNLWLALLASAPIRIAAIYHSGKRGYHALVRTDAQTKLEADDICEIARREYGPLGACTGSLTSFRLSRLPNCQRDQSGQLQRLIYLNPDPTSTAIKDQPLLRKVSQK
jgi:hypothetical protein